MTHAEGIRTAEDIISFLTDLPRRDNPYILPSDLATALSEARRLARDYHRQIRYRLPVTIPQDDSEVVSIGPVS